MNTVGMYAIIFFAMFAVPASSDCSPENIVNLHIQCTLDLNMVEEFKEAAALESLEKSKPKDHYYGCCMEQALASCYRKKQPADCSTLVDLMIKKNKDTVNKIFDGRPCNYNCPISGSFTLKPTWALTMTIALVLFIFKKDTQ